MKGVTKLFIKVIFSIIMLLLVFAISLHAFEYVWPMLRHGPCWGSVVGGINDLSGKINRGAPEVKSAITLRECAGSLSFVTKSDMTMTKGFEETVECKSGNGYIVGIPYFPDTDAKWWNPITWAKDIGENIRQYLIDKKLKNIHPVCNEVKYGFYETKQIEGPAVKGEEEEAIYCFTLQRTIDVYSVSYIKVEDKEECS